MELLRYRAEPTLARFHNSRAFVRGVRGPIGSGKSVACCWEIFRKGLEIQPDPYGKRKSRWAVIRNTYPELKTTTIKTWTEWFQGLGKMNWSTPPTFWLKQDLEDGTHLEIEVMFLAMDNEQHTKKLLSLELTGVWLNEARELPLSVIVNAMSRVGRYPKKTENQKVPNWNGVIMDTNSPSEFHWWYDRAEVNTPKNWEFFDQPPAVLKVNGAYKVNPAAENLRNIPKGQAYYEDMLSGNTVDFIDVMLCCLYKSLFTGKKVYEDYNDNLHVSNDPLIVDEERELVLSFDFGLTPACVVAQETAAGQLRVLAEYVSENMGLTQFLENMVLPDLNRRFRNCKKVVATGDPAGVQRSQANSEDSCAAVLERHGLKFTPCTTNDFEPRRRAVLDRLNRFACGAVAYILDPSCIMLRQGFNGGYQFKLLSTRLSTGENQYSLEPEKNMFSHIHDANQYMAMYFEPNRYERSQKQNALIQQAMARSRRARENYSILN